MFRPSRLGSSGSPSSNLCLFSQVGLPLPARGLLPCVVSLQSRQRSWSKCGAHPVRSPLSGITTPWILPALLCSVSMNRRYLLHLALIAVFSGRVGSNHKLLCCGRKQKPGSNHLQSPLLLPGSGFSQRQLGRHRLTREGTEVTHSFLRALDIA